MSWMPPVLLSCLAMLFILTSLYEVDSAVVSDGKENKKAGSQRENDANNFFKRRGRRATKSQDEIDAEQRHRLAADERKREYHEDQRNEFEKYAEEEHDEQDEQDERTTESTEQWRQFHHDGLDPSQEYNRHTV